MTISKARQILGKDAESYSDEELGKLMEKFKKLALFCVAEIDKREDAGQLNFESPK